MELFDKIVEFDKYCKTCEYRDLDEKFDPCHECLSEPTVFGSIKPINYKEDEKKIKEESKKEKK